MSGVTDVNDESRFSQIRSFIDNNDVDNFVIIDDIDILEGMTNTFAKLRDVVFFQTNPKVGLTDAIADKMIAALNSNK